MTSLEILYKQSLSTTSNTDCQLLYKKSCQKSHQKLSLMKTKNGVSSKIVCFGILIHILSWRQHKHQCLCFHYWEFLTNFWFDNWQSIFDIVERIYYLLCKSENSSFSSHTFTSMQEDVLVINFIVVFFLLSLPLSFKFTAGNPVTLV